MLGHQRQAKDNLIFNQGQHVKTPCAQDTILIILVDPARHILIERRFGIDKPQTAFRLDCPIQRRQTTLARQSRTSLHVQLQETLARRTLFAAQRPRYD